MIREIEDIIIIICALLLTYLFIKFKNGALRKYMIFYFMGVSLTYIVRYIALLLNNREDGFTEIALIPETVAMIALIYYMYIGRKIK